MESSTKQPSSKPKRILILSSSPQRDKVVDDLIADELRQLGHKVWVKACLRQGRDAVLKLKPDIVVSPPVRNVYSRDFVSTLKEWGVAVVSRHTECSCDWPDFKTLSPNKRVDILGRLKYEIDVEIVWGPDEAQILARRNCPFPVIPVGPLSLDIYFKPDYQKKFSSKVKFNKRYKFDPKKKTLLIGAPWGFADSAPDLSIDETRKIQEKEQASQASHLDMITYLHSKLSCDWNILLRPHPGVMAQVYVDLAKKLKIPIDIESVAGDLLVNSDALIHAGSTMALEMHYMNKPSFQYGDVNCQLSWWVKPQSIMSKVSPFFDNPYELALAVGSSIVRSNANTEIIKELEEGRYGKIDGQATKRCADIIAGLNGKFNFSWPVSQYNYSQGFLTRNEEDVMSHQRCGICNKEFVILHDDWLGKLGKYIKSPIKMPDQTICPWCGCRFFRHEMSRKGN